MSDTVLRAEVSPEEFDPFAGPALLRTAPSTEPQREIWTACRVGDDASLAFNESNVLQLEGALDVPALRTAVCQLVERHEALHTTFSSDGLTLCVAESYGVDVPMVDLSRLPDAERETRWQQLLVAEVEKTFDLERGPLVRYQLVRLAPTSHRLVFTSHHIVCDGWSTAVLMKDLAKLYARAAGGDVPPLDDAEPFSAYARSESEAASELDESEAYWLRQFAEPATPLDLPTDRPRPALKSYSSRREDHVLSSELVARLKKAGARCGASFFTTLLAGFKAFAHRVTGQEDLVVGIPAAGQSLGGHDSLVGHCVNMLALRSRVDARQPFQAVLKSLRTTMLDAYEHQRLTYGALLRKLPLPRDPSRLPLVSVIFNLDQALSADDLRLPGLEAAFWTNPRRFENFELFVNAVENRGEVVLEVQYNSDLFDAATVRRFMASYETLLHGIAADTSTEIGALPLLTGSDRSQLAAWNATAEDYPRVSCVHELVEQRARAVPEKTAIAFGDLSVSYRELNATANRIARALRARGVRRKTLVGLCLERSPEMLAALLGILKAGGAYVPLDPAYPADRLAHMVEDSGMPVLVSESRLRDRLPASGGRPLWLDDEREVLAGLDGDDLAKDDASAGPEDPAYVIYTSGSTGRPKGVAVPHRAATNLVSSVAREPGLGADDVIVALTTLSFDIAVAELLLPLTVGARIALASRDTAGDGAALARLLGTSGVTIMSATPATWRMLLAAGWRGGAAFRAVCTGEALPADLAVDLVAAAGEVWNMYGPTETTVWSTRERLGRPPGPITIGRPLGNTQCHVLDSRMQPVPIGVPGELHIGGDGVTLGYLGRPELTAERFVADPFRDGGLLYKTGDLARFLADGRIEYLGRNDNQVKVRGFRIELGEIESVLSRHRGIGQGVVVAREFRPGDVRLVAYFVPAAGPAPADQDLRDHLRRSLPDYMVPQHFVSLAAFPLTPSGKIDRKALPTPATDRPGTEFVEPRTASERLVAELWQDALGVPRLSVSDNFFHLGGHSLLASQVLARLRRDHAISVPFRKLFEAPTVERFAALLAQEGPGAAPAVRIPRRSETGPAPLTLMQQRLLFLEEMDPGLRSVHRLGSAFRLRGSLDHEALRRSIEKVVERHDVLRTVVVWQDGVPLQLVRPPEPLALPVDDWSGRTPGERESALLPHLRELTRAPHDLGERPAFEARLFRLADEDHVLYFRTHNAVWDGWSFDIFRRELDRLYSEATGGPKAALPELPISYSDFAVWHREWMQSPEIARQTSYWHERLAGEPPVLDLRTDRPRGEKETYEAATVSMRFTREEADRLTALGREHDATLFMVLLTTFELLLHRYTGQDEILVGTPVQGRSQPEVENLIGFFVNHLVLRLHARPEDRFVDLLGRVRGTTLDAFSHQEMPFELLGRQAPVLRAFFSLQDARERALSMGALSLEQLQAVSPGGGADVILWFMEQKGELLAALNFRTDLFERSTMTRLLDHYRCLLAAALADPRQPAFELAMMDAAEEARVRGLARPAPASESPETSFLEAFAGQAAGTPESTAVSSAGAGLSYAELDRRSRALAAKLRAHGVKPGSVVGIAVGRSANLPMAVVAVLRAGGACLPVDASAPPDALALLLDSSGVSVVVADADGRADLPPACSATVLAIDDPDDAAPDAPDASAPVTLDDAAFVLPVTGAAGQLTGAAVSHHELLRFVTAGRELLGLRPGDRVLGLSSPARVNGLAECLLPLSAGASLLFAEDDVVEEPARLREALRASGATVLVAPPAVWSGLAREGSDPLGVTAVCSPEPLSPAEAAALLPRVATLWQAWAPTGAGAWTALQRVGEASEAPQASPLPGAALQVLEASGRPCPLDVPGALADSAGARTADAAPLPMGVRARRREDGRLEWLGRTDGRVLIAERLVDPAGIEQVLRGHPAVADAAVAAVEERGRARIVAYVTGAEGDEPSAAELRRLVRRCLGEALVPASFVVLPALPRTPDGGIDRRSLPSLAKLRAESGATTAPRTAAERSLAEAWREVLGVEPGVHDNFFDLGGHSLLATVLVHRVQQTMGRRLGLRALMFQTLEQIALTLDAGAPPTASGS